MISHCCHRPTFNYRGVVNGRDLERVGRKKFLIMKNSPKNGRRLKGILGGGWTWQQWWWQWRRGRVE